MTFTNISLFLKKVARDPPVPRLFQQCRNVKLTVTEQRCKVGCTQWRRLFYQGPDVKTVEKLLLYTSYYY